MKLDDNVNYIVSGLERSGTSMIMQILKAGDIPVSFDLSRPPDDNNPKGYFELEGGKIINRLIEGVFPFNDYKGKFIKITSYGIKFLPPGSYKIIYSERNLNEILDSMEKMARLKDEKRNKTFQSFKKLNKLIKKQIKIREDIDCLFVNYNNILSNPKEDIKKIKDFIGASDEVFNDMLSVVDNGLYRNKNIVEDNGE